MIVVEWCLLLVRLLSREVSQLYTTSPFLFVRDWFTALYEVLLGASQGPRFGGFIALYGVDETVALIDDALAGKLTTA